MISVEQFQAVEMRVGKVLRAELLIPARMPAYAFWIDFGEFYGIRQSSAQITIRYTPEQLIGRLVIAVTNLPPKRIAGFLSEVLVLGVPDSQGNVVLLQPDANVPLGVRVF